MAELGKAAAWMCCSLVVGGVLFGGGGWEVDGNGVGVLVVVIGEAVESRVALALTGAVLGPSMSLRTCIRRSLVELGFSCTNEQSNPPWSMLVSVSPASRSASASEESRRSGTVGVRIGVVEDGDASVFVGESDSDDGLDDVVDTASGSGVVDIEGAATRCILNNNTAIVKIGGSRQWGEIGVRLTNLTLNITT